MDSNNQRTITLEQALYAGLFILALLLRLVNLGAAPLTETEAGYAMQAYNLAHGRLETSLTNPAYGVITGLLFSIFKDSNAVARFFPALAGSSLVLLPLFFYNLTRLSLWTRRASLLFALALAVDPALVALSRLAGSPLVALAGVFLALGFIWRGKPGWAGGLAGLALLSGPGWMPGFLSFTLAVLLWILLRRQTGAVLAEDVPSLAFMHAELKSFRFWRTAALSAAVVVILGGMLSLRLPQGLAGIAESLPVYLRGWLEPSGIPALRLPAAIAFYQPLAVLLGVIFAIRSWLGAQPLFSEGRFLSLWAVAAMGFCMLYPARQVADAAWVLIPLWALAALEISRYTLSSLEEVSRLPALGLGGLITLFLGLIWYNLLRLSNLQAQPALYLAILGGLVMMAVIVIILATLGWSWKVASFGVCWGVCLIASVYMVSAMWGMSQVRPSQPAELWSLSPGAGAARDLTATLDDVSEWEHGMMSTLDIRVTFTSTSLQWLLRRYPSVQFSPILASDERPSVVISQPSQPDLSLASSYRGQELVWSQSAGWTGVLPPNLLRWITYREAPNLPQNLVLWVRSDIFPAGAQTSDSGQGAVPVP